jgi:signal transduction histidine kinase
MFAETLLLGRVRSEAEQRRSLEIIDQEARRLTHLVENVLHFSRAERRIARLAPESTVLGGLLKDVSDGFAPLAASQRTALRLALQSGVMASVDPSAIRQILLNLLDNAVKYGAPEQTVVVGLALVGATGREPRQASGAAPSAATAVARIWVDDGGPGVAPSDRDRIWERFWRLPDEAQSAVAGTGIGLAVVRELVALHGGRAWVEDAPGGGARFVVEIPHAWPASEQSTSPHPGAGTSPPPKARDTAAGSAGESPRRGSAAP